MSPRPPSDWPRLSGRPVEVPRNERQNLKVIRRFFDLIERMERPGAPANKANPPQRNSNAKERR